MYAWTHTHDCHTIQPLSSTVYVPGPRSEGKGSGRKVSLMGKPSRVRLSPFPHFEAGHQMIWEESVSLILVAPNRPLHNAPLPAVSSALLASDLKRWLQPNPKVLSRSLARRSLARRPVADVFWSKPIYFIKIDGLWFWWEKTHPKVKAVFWDTGPCVDNITGLQLVLSCPPWSDGKGKVHPWEEVPSSWI